MLNVTRIKTLSAIATVVLGCGIATAQNGNWLMSGGDVQRSGWNKDEHILSKTNVGKMKLLWKTKTDVYPQGLHTLMDPLVVQNVPTANGPKEIVYILGVGDTLYAFDARSGAPFFEHHFKYPTPKPEVRLGPDGQPRPQQAQPADTRHYNFLNPGGSTDVPVIGEPDAKGIRPIYVIDGGGTLHVLSNVTGEDIQEPIKANATSKFALQLYKGSIIWAGRGGIFSAVITPGPDYGKVTTSKGFGGGGGLWGRRGPVITSDGTVWTTTGDGPYNPSNTSNLVLGNSVVGFQLKEGHWEVKNWFTPPNWDWLRRRDLDPNNTPTAFTFHGKEYMAASGKECRLYLLDPDNPGGTTDHHTPFIKTDYICNEMVDFASAGSWGAVSSWEDKGTRWVLVPFWGAKHSKFKFPIENTPVTKEGGVGAFKLVEEGGKPVYKPVWVSRDMFRGEPPIIANGVVYTWGSGDDTQQVWPDIGLNFDSSNRAALANHVTVYALDAQTGKELWSSKDQIPSFNHFTGITVANGKVYISSYDGNVYCFGL